MSTSSDDESVVSVHSVIDVSVQNDCELNKVTVLERIKQFANNALLSGSKWSAMSKAKPRAPSGESSSSAGKKRLTKGQKVAAALVVEPAISYVGGAAWALTSLIKRMLSPYFFKPLKEPGIDYDELDRRVSFIAL